MNNDKNNGYDTLIFDLGDVLFTWSAETKTTISPKTLHKFLESSTWFEYEKGQLSEAECYASIAQEFGIEVKEVEEAFLCARDSLTGRAFMVDLIRELKSGRKVYAMSNISAPDWEVLKTKVADWDIFDGIFTSAAVGERKPNLGFYRHVIRETGANPKRAIFVDDKLDNLIAARSLGVTTVIYDTFENVARSLCNLCNNPIARAIQFIGSGADHHLSYTSTGHVIQENFSRLLILEAIRNNFLVDPEYTKYDGIMNFFNGHGQLTDYDYPCDLDTTAIGLTLALNVDSSTKARIMDAMLQYRNSDNILQVYFDERRPRQDPVVCVNVLTFFYLNGRGNELEDTLDWVQSVLQNRAYLGGTRYYVTAEAFLFFIARLLRVSASVKQRLGALFKERCGERIGSAGDALALAMRVHCCNEVGLDAKVDLERLLEMQQLDGGWGDGWIYRYGSRDIKVANRALTTAIAIQAVQR